MVHHVGLQAGKKVETKNFGPSKAYTKPSYFKARKESTRPGHRKYKQRTLWKVGVWNVPYDPWTKTCNIFKLARQRQWNVVLLTDVAFPESTPKQVKVDGITWSILVAGKVAVAMDNWATQTWIQGGKVQQVSSLTKCEPF